MTESPNKSAAADYSKPTFSLRLKALAVRRRSRLVNFGFITSVFAVAIALAGCSATRDVAPSPPVTTVPPWLLVEIRSETPRPYHITFTGRDYSRREILAYLRTAAPYRLNTLGIAIRPRDTTVDFYQRHSAPLFEYGRRHRIPITYLDPTFNAVDAYVFASRQPYGTPFAKLP
jgi:hypothetical protein